MKIAPFAYLTTLTVTVLGLTGCGGGQLTSSSASSAPSSTPTVVIESPAVANYDYNTNRFCRPFTPSAITHLERYSVECEDALKLARGMTREEYHEFLQRIGMTDGFFGDEETYADMQNLAAELSLCPLPTLSAPSGSYFDDAEQTLKEISSGYC